MQTPITFLPAQPAANASSPVKSNVNASETAQSSFKQVLSKEISEKQNTPKDKPKSDVENKAIPQDFKKNTSSQPTKIEPIADENEKNELIPVGSDQSNGVQLIALVASLAQFSQVNSDKQILPTKSDISAIDASAISTVVDKTTGKFPLGESSINQPLQINDVTLIDAVPLSATTGMKLPVDLKVDPKADLKNDLSVANMLDTKVAPTDDINGVFKLDPKTSLKEDLKVALSAEPPTSAKVGLSSSSIDQKTDLKMQAQVEIKEEFKIDAKQNLKSDLTADLKGELKSEAKSNLKTDLKIQEITNFKEQSIKVAESSPSTQNFAQQIAVSSAQINASNEVTHLAPRVGSQAWDQSVGQKIIWMVAGGQQTAELTLNPPDLGPMQVVLSVNNDQANATFISAHPDVRDALESAMPKLRQMMSDAGVQLSGFSVKSDSSNPGAQFTGGGTSPRAKNNTPSTLSGTNAVSATTSATNRSSGTGIVDTFA